VEFATSRVVIEEKIDGANLGISIDPDTFEVLFQNRAHYVSSATATQFKKLGHWLTQHRGALFELLEPGRHILFGEWVFARHSIPYTDLPGFFVAFDVFDTQSKIFWSRRRLDSALSGTSIPCIRVISEEIPGSVDRLVSLATTTVSAYYPGLVEGIVVRICDEAAGCTCKRAKIVRPGFLGSAADASSTLPHWTSRSMEQNRLDLRKA
jgi:atypical dual specificity phosphatase